MDPKLMMEIMSGQIDKKGPVDAYGMKNMMEMLNQVEKDPELKR